MKPISGPGIIAGLFLIGTLAANGQTPSANPSNSLSLPTRSQTMPEESKYQYDFIAQHYVWSNKPLNTTASKICKTMKDHAFSETPYAINGQHDWSSCLDTQIRSIGYMRWLQNSGIKINSKNRKSAKAYLHNTYTMGSWGSYSFAQLRHAFQAAKGEMP